MGFKLTSVCKNVRILCFLGSFLTAFHRMKTLITFVIFHLQAEKYRTFSCWA